MKLVSKQIRDEETGIDAHITHKSITASGKGGDYFIFKNSDVDTVEKVAKALLRFVDAAREEVAEQYIK